MRLALWIALPVLFLRNLNPVVGGKALFLAGILSSRLGVDVLPLFDVRTAVAFWCWAYQPLLLVPVAFLFAEILPCAPSKPPASMRATVAAQSIV